jgi:hypothetical protein
MTIPDLAAFVGYLRAAGWTLEDEDGRTTLWSRERAEADIGIKVVLPASQEVRDYADRAYEALRAVAAAERRLPKEVMEDILSGGADNVAVRLTPETPPGEAPLQLFYSAVSGLRNYVVASAAALSSDGLVLPHRRPQRAEAYAARTRLSTQPGSFVLSLTLPLDEDQAETADEQDVPGSAGAQPFGRRVTRRMLTAARRAQELAQQVSDGILPLTVFGEPGPESANATELAALGSLGGPDHDLYQIRFALSPLAGEGIDPVRLKITPGQQRILGEAADFLRTKQPRENVTVTGLVVRLFRERAGTGEAVVQGVDDDSGAERRFRVELTEHDYRQAIRAHELGLRVAATGDLKVRGNRRSLRPLISFSVLPGSDDD